ncbi:hypothetical protein DESC_180081 [Desulfosarcina cetonica]|nr:hypothetical protein DESC_180081 [Desulfosarcina cetonica]
MADRRGASRSNLRNFGDGSYRRDAAPVVVGVGGYPISRFGDAHELFAQEERGS